MENDDSDEIADLSTLLEDTEIESLPDENGNK